jgi:hypothetical protein
MPAGLSKLEEARRALEEAQTSLDERTQGPFFLGWYVHETKFGIQELLQSLKRVISEYKLRKHRAFQTDSGTTTTRLQFGANCLPVPAAPVRKIRAPLLGLDQWALIRRTASPDSPGDTLSSNIRVCELYDRFLSVPPRV